MTQTEFMRGVQKDHGLNEVSAAVLDRTFETTHGVSVEQAVWLRAIEMTDKEQGG